MSKPKISKALAARALSEMLTGMAGGSGSADLRQLLGAPGTPPPGSALAELARLKAEAAAASPPSGTPADVIRRTPSPEMEAMVRQVAERAVADALAKLLAGTGDKPDGGAK